MVRLCEVNPDLVATTTCWPGAMSVSVHGLWQSGLPSNVICAPAGADETVTCASTGAAAWVFVCPRRLVSGAGGCSSTVRVGSGCAGGGAASVCGGGSAGVGATGCGAFFFADAVCYGIASGLELWPS